MTLHSAAFSARATVALSQPSSALMTICRQFEEYGEAVYDQRRGRVRTAFGEAHFEAGDDTLTLIAEGQDETQFSYIKWSLAEHLIGFAASETPVIEWSGQDELAGKPLPFFREMRVVANRAITPMVRRLTLSGHDLERFTGGAMHVRLLFPVDQAAPQWPVMGMDGRPQWPEVEHRPIARIYTVRGFDLVAGTVDIDIVLHEGASPGSDFARGAVAGDIVGMLGPSGEAPPDADWYLFAGDETALPAIARMLPMLPEGATAVVRIEIADEGERQKLVSEAALDLQWIYRDGAKAGTTSLLDPAVKAVQWPGEGVRCYVWGGCEFAAFKSLRAYARKDRGLKREQNLITAYWRHGSGGADADAEA